MALRLHRSLAILMAAALAALSGCNLPQRYRAAEDIRVFLQAVRNDDRAAFEAHIDRPALRAELQDELGQVASRSGLGAGVDAILGSQAGARLADEMITPESFRIAWSGAAPALQKIPPAAEIALLLKVTGPDEVCLHDARRDRCILSFRDEGGTWKLTGASTSGARVDGPAPQP